MYVCFDLGESGESGESGKSFSLFVFLLFTKYLNYTTVYLCQPLHEHIIRLTVFVSDSKY